MKRMAIIAILCMVMAGSSYAERMPTDEDYKNLDELRVKLMRMRREMDRFMKDIVSTYPEQEKFAMEDLDQDVRVDITQNDKYIVVRADMPGMDKDKIDITLENNKILKIAGTREVLKKESAQGTIRQERMSGKFERVLELPTECKNEGISAQYKNGVLEITIPKKAETKEEAVKISVQ